MRQGLPNHLQSRTLALFRNLPEFGRRIRFDVLHGCETCSLDAHFSEYGTAESHWQRDPENTVFGWRQACCSQRGIAFRNHGGHQIECDGRNPEDSKSLPSVLPTMAGSMEQVFVCVCVCAQGSYFEGDWLSVVVCPTITVLYHNSGKFLTASRIIVVSWRRETERIEPNCNKKYLLIIIIFFLSTFWYNNAIIEEIYCCTGEWAPLLEHVLVLKQILILNFSVYGTKYL